MDEQLKTFKEKGYVYLRGLLTPAEVKRLNEAMDKDNILLQNEYGRRDGQGMKTRLSAWNSLPDTIVGAIARSHKVVGTVEKLLEGEVYHYHSKVIKKDPHTGGAFLWHQDYGYWYEHKCLYPTMGTLWIAIDKADKSNGCLQILEGSHLVGRLNHQRTGDQATADPERIEILKKRLPLRYTELEAGDAMFFHSNLVHRSDQNLSDKRRWAFLICYNRADNIPCGQHPNADYKPLKKVADSVIMTSPLVTDGKNVEFWNLNMDAALARMKNS